MDGDTYLQKALADLQTAAECIDVGTVLTEKRVNFRMDRAKLYLLVAIAQGLEKVNVHLEEVNAHLQTISTLEFDS